MLGFSGEQMRIAAQSWWILGEGGSNTEVGLAAGLRLIPVILISLYAGVMIDRYGGKKVLVVERILLVLLALATALILLWDGVEVWHIVVLSTIAGTTIAIGMPAVNTLAPEIVPTDLRPRANLFNQVTFSAGRTLGPLLAGLLIAVKGAVAAFYGLAIVYLLSALVTLRLPPSKPAATGSGSAIQQIAEGLRYIRKTPVVFWILILQGFSLIFWVFSFPLVPAMAKEVLDTSEVQFGWMWGALALGQGLTAVLLGWRGTPNRQSISLFAAATVYGAGLILLGFTETYWLALVYLFAMGIAFPLWVAPLATLLQNFTAVEYRGRVMAVNAIAMQSMALSWIAGGFLLDVVGIPTTAVIAVAGGWAVLLIVMIASPDLRRA
jgi:MFS family permease